MNHKNHRLNNLTFKEKQISTLSSYFKQINFASLNKVSLFSYMTINFYTLSFPKMCEKIPGQNLKEFRYESPSKKSMFTPTKAALVNSGYKVGIFLEKMNELNTIKMRLKNTKLNKQQEKGEENEAL